MFNKIILVTVSLALAYFGYKTIPKMLSKEGFTCSANDCPQGCSRPKTVPEDCPSTLYKDAATGNCYRRCPYQCLNSEDDCKDNSCCGGCGYKQFSTVCSDTAIKDTNDEDSGLIPVGPPPPAIQPEVDEKSAVIPSDTSEDPSTNGNPSTSPQIFPSDTDSSSESPTSIDTAVSAQTAESMQNSVDNGCQTVTQVKMPQATQTDEAVAAQQAQVAQTSPYVRRDTTGMFTDVHPQPYAFNISKYNHLEGCHCPVCLFQADQPKAM